MPNPDGDGLEIDPGLDGVADEVMAQTVVGEIGYRWMTEFGLNLPHTSRCSKAKA